MSYLFNRTTAYIRRSPLLYTIAKHIKNRQAGEFLCHRDTDLCLEGYPSSANTFVFNLLVRLNPSLRVAHHCHTIANLKLALVYRVPLVVLIRHPEGAVSSTVARFGGDVTQALSDYIEFYEFVQRNAGRMTVVRFEDIVDDTVAALGLIAEASGIQIDLTDLEAKKGEVLIHIHQWSREHGKSAQASAPSDDRERKKAPIRHQLHRSRRFRRAEQLYGAVVAAVPAPRRQS